VDGTELPASVPDDVRDCWIHLGGLHVPENMDPVEQEVYKRGAGANPKCMLCEGPLGEETLIIVNLTGINQIYCSHRCMSDMIVLGYLASEYDDRKQQVDFRGSQVH
jgi:hypothetical protein